MSKKIQVSRRRLLKGFSNGILVTSGIPILDIMLDQNGEAFADGDEIKAKFVQFYSPFSPNMKAATEFSDDPDIQAQVNICTGLGAASGHGGGANDHVNGGGPTALALLWQKQLKTSTSLSDMVVSLDRRGQTAAKNGGSNVNGESSPQKFLEQVFGAGSEETPAQKEARLNRAKRKVYIADALLGDAKTLKKILGQQDKFKLDKFLDSMNDVQTQLVRASEGKADVCKAPELASGQAGDLKATASLFAKILAQGIICGRISTGFLAFSQETPFGNVGNYNGLHNSSHGDQATIRQLLSEVVFPTISEIIIALKDTEVGGGTLFDTTIFSGTTNVTRGDSNRQAMAYTIGGSKLWKTGIIHTGNGSLRDFQASIAKALGVTDFGGNSISSF